MTNDKSLPSDMADSFPPPREDEPASLRRDIIDELADHLACAALREQHRNPNPSQIQQAVLNRFGNPNQIARQLWRDAMWEKIMTQRISIIMTSILGIACVYLSVLVWQSTDQLERAQQSLSASVEAMRAQQKTDRDASQSAFNDLAKSLNENRPNLLSKDANGDMPGPSPIELHGMILDLKNELRKSPQLSLSALPETQNSAPGAVIPAVPSTVEFRFLSGSKSGPPVAGARVRMWVPGNPSLYEAIADDEGTVQFGSVQPLLHEVEVDFVDDHLLNGIYRKFRLLVPIGGKKSMVLICPENSLRPIHADVQIAWPEDLQSIPISFGFQMNELRNEYGWQTRPTQNSEPLAMGLDTDESLQTAVLVSPENQIYRGSFTKQPAAGFVKRTLTTSTMDGIAGPNFNSLQLMNFNITSTESMSQIAWPSAVFLPAEITVMVTPFISRELELQLTHAPKNLFGENRNAPPVWRTLNDILHTKHSIVSTQFITAKPQGSTTTEVASAPYLDPNLVSTDVSKVVFSRELQANICVEPTYFEGFKFPLFPADSDADTRDRPLRANVNFVDGLTTIQILPPEDLVQKVRIAVSICKRRLAEAQAICRKEAAMTSKK